MAGKHTRKTVAEDSRYHDTWRLLRKYRDVVWSMELSVQQVKKEFEIEFGSTIDDFLESVYLAGADLGGTKIENHARCIERSNQMLTLLNNAVELLRTRHKNGESYYFILRVFVPAAVGECKRNHETAPAAYPGHQPDNLLPKTGTGSGGPQLHPLGLYLQGLYGAAGGLFLYFRSISTF